MRLRAARTTPLLLLPIALTSFAACMIGTEPLPDGSRRIAAPLVYQVWWDMTELCSGRTGQLGTVDWYVVPGVAQFEHKGRPVSGYWSSAGNRVVLAERAMTDGGLVRHEMLHALLGHSGHSRDAFDCRRVEGWSCYRSRGTREDGCSADITVGICNSRFGRRRDFFVRRQHRIREVRCAVDRDDRSHGRRYIRRDLQGRGRRCKRLSQVAANQR